MFDGHQYLLYARLSRQEENRKINAVCFKQIGYRETKGSLVWTTGFAKLASHADSYILGNVFAPSRLSKAFRSKLMSGILNAVHQPVEKRPKYLGTLTDPRNDSDALSHLLKELFIPNYKVFIALFDIGTFLLVRVCQYIC